jgi:hypothetical protein
MVDFLPKYRNRLEGGTIAAGFLKQLPFKTTADVYLQIIKL